MFFSGQHLKLFSKREHLELFPWTSQVLILGIIFAAQFAISVRVHAFCLWRSQISFSISRQCHVFDVSNKQNLEFQSKNASELCNCRKFELLVCRPYHVFLCSMCSKPGFWHHNVSKMCNSRKIDFHICDSIMVSFISIAKTQSFGIIMYRKCVTVSNSALYLLHFSLKQIQTSSVSPI